MKNILLTLILTIVLLISGANEGFASSATYKIKKGDTLYKISQMHNTTVAKLKSWNNLKSDLIFPNEKLSIGSNAKKSKKAADKPASKAVSRSTSTNAGKEFTVSATAYPANGNFCSGINKNRAKVLRKNSDLKVIAVDPNVIDLETKVHVEG